MDLGVYLYGKSTDTAYFILKFNSLTLFPYIHIWLFWKGICNPIFFLLISAEFLLLNLHS